MQSSFTDLKRKFSQLNFLLTQILYTQIHTSSLTSFAACHCSVHVKGAICPTPNCLIPNSTNKDTVGLPTLFGMASDLSYNPKASLFDELGMRLKNPLFLKTAPLMFEYCTE